MRSKPIAKDFLWPLQRHLEHSDFFERHILARAGFLVCTVAFLVTRIADLVLGMIAVVFSILTLGCFASINNAAFRGLQFFGVIGDLVHGIAGVINPAVEFDATHYGTSLGRRILEKGLVIAAGQTQAQLIAQALPNIRHLLPAQS